MLRIPAVILVLALLWLASRHLSRVRGLQLGLLGIAGFVVNIARAWGRGLSTMELINFNFSDTSMLLVNLASAACCRASKAGASATPAPSERRDAPSSRRAEGTTPGRSRVCRFSLHPMSGSPARVVMVADLHPLRNRPCPPSAHSSP